MYCHNVPGVLIFSYDRLVSVHLSNLSALQLQSLSLCSWVPSKSQHPATFFSQSESYLWLFHPPWSLELTYTPVDLSPLTRWNLGCEFFMHFCFVPFRLHFKFLFISCFFMYYISNDEIFYPYLLLLMCFFFHQKLDGPFKVKVTKYLFRTSFSHLSLPECAPFWVRVVDTLYMPSFCVLSLSPRNILQVVLIILF